MYILHMYCDLGQTSTGCFGKDHLLHSNPRIASRSGFSIDCDSWGLLEHLGTKLRSPNSEDER